MILLLLLLQLVSIDLLPPAERKRITTAAEEALREAPKTIVAYHAARSAGGVHDFFSEGDFWWPDPEHPGGPYIKKDGLTNPGNFNDHRIAVIQCGQRVTSLAAAFRMTGDRRFARHALQHLRAWFADTSTMMSPHLLYAQAIKGRVTGRGIGIIGTIHLIEVAQAISILERDGGITHAEAVPLVAWFSQYLQWLTTHPYGLQEREEKNNHGTWWVAQVAAFASLTGDAALLDSCRRRYRTVLLPGQLSPDGSFPLELARTKPYNYSLFNLEGMAVICRLLSTPHEDLWTFTLTDGRTIRRAFQYLAPFVVDKSRWPFPPDVMNFEMFPARQMAWLFAGQAFGDSTYTGIWQRLDPDQRNEEIARTFPLREPLLWSSAP
jgi:hypothetical protein